MYRYEDLKEDLFTEEGFAMLKQAYSNIVNIKTETFSHDDITENICGDSYQMLACIDYLLKDGTIRCDNNLDARYEWRYSK